MIGLGCYRVGSDDDDGLVQGGIGSLIYASRDLASHRNNTGSTNRSVMTGPDTGNR